MQYSEVSIWTSSQAVDAVTEWLRMHGIDGVAIEDREDFERTYPDRYGELYALLDADFPAKGARIRAYVPELPTELTEEAIRQAVLGLAKYGVDPGDAKVIFRAVNDEDWADAWKRYYHPTAITERLTVVPSWENYQAKPGEVVLLLDPGMAFGTGTHPTTSLILQLMDRYLQRGDFVVDVGCGSGILSIAAAKLGASSVLALDLDPVAVEVSRENCKMNEVEHAVEVKRNDLLQGIDMEAPHLIVSNILADILLRIIDDAYQLLQQDGLLLLSGIISTRTQEILDALTQAGFAVDTRLQEGDWVALAARKPSRT